MRTWRLRAPRWVLLCPPPLRLRKSRRRKPRLKLGTSRRFRRWSSTLRTRRSPASRNGRRRRARSRIPATAPPLPPRKELEAPRASQRTSSLSDSSTSSAEPSSPVTRCGPSPRTPSTARWRWHPVWLPPTRAVAATSSLSSCAASIVSRFRCLSTASASTSRPTTASTSPASSPRTSPRCRSPRAIPPC